MLSAAGIPCTIVLDAAVGYYIERMDMILVGAEGVVENGGLINQVSPDLIHSPAHGSLGRLVASIMVDWHISNECHGQVGRQALLCPCRKLQICPLVSVEPVRFAKCLQQLKRAFVFHHTGLVKRNRHPCLCVCFGLCLGFRCRVKHGDGHRRQNQRSTQHDHAIGRLHATFIHHTLVHRLGRADTVRCL